MRGLRKSPPLHQALRPCRGQCLTVNLQEPNTAPRRSKPQELKAGASDRKGGGDVPTALPVASSWAVFFPPRSWPHMARSSLRIPECQRDPDAAPLPTPSWHTARVRRVVRCLLSRLLLRMKDLGCSCHGTHHGPCCSFVLYLAFQ